MYSVVLMAALSTGGGAESVGQWGCNGCGGCSGCYGYTAGWGGGCGGCRGGFGCGGCRGGFGFLGASHGRWGCHGCNGGGCYGAGCYGAGYANGYGYAAHTASYGCHGSCFGTAVTPYRVIDHRAARPPEELKAKPKPEPGASLTPNRARLIVELPADAKLYIDDNLTNGRSGERSFATPELAPGEQYFYEVRAELVRDGQLVAHQTERVTFRPGEEKRITLRDVAFKPVETKATAQR